MLQAVFMLVGLTSMCQLTKGVDGAHSDDTASLKSAVAHWLNEHSPPPDPPVIVKSKTWRGFFHRVTGELLCPAEYDWTDKM